MPIDTTDLDTVMRTTFACREWTDDPVTDEDIEEIVELARFAPSGGNRQPNRLVAVRAPETKRAIRLAAEPVMRVYFEQTKAGEAPWNTINPTSVDLDEHWISDGTFDFVSFIEKAPVLLVVGCDLSVVASFDSRLDRVGVISGASIYPFAWSLLLAARSRGLGGVMTTMAAGNEAEVQQLLGFPPHVAVAAVLPIGRPVKQLTKLTRAPVSDILRHERWED